MTKAAGKAVTKPVTEPVTKSVTKLNHILQFWTKISKQFWLSVTVSGQNYRQIRVSVSVSDRNQNSGFGRSLISAGFRFSKLQ